MSLKKEILGTISWIKTKRGWNDTRIADELNVTRQALSRWKKTGKITTENYLALQTLAGNKQAFTANKPSKLDKSITERTFHILVSSFDDYYEVPPKLNAARFRAVYAYLSADNNPPKQTNLRDEDHTKLKAMLETII